MKRKNGIITAFRVGLNSTKAMASDGISWFIDEILNYLFNPMFFISFLGPLVVGSNYFMITNLDKNAKIAAENPFTYALISYNIQYFVLIIAFVFFIAQTFLAVKNLFHNHSFNELHPKLKKSKLTKVFLIFYLGIFSFMMYGMVKMFPQIDISLYLKENEVKIFPFFDFAWPPNAPITYLRIAIGLYGICLSYWVKKIFPYFLIHKDVIPS